MQYPHRVIKKSVLSAKTHKNGQDNFLLPLSGANWFTYDVNVDMVSFQFFLLLSLVAPGLPLLLLFRLVLLETKKYPRRSSLSTRTSLTGSGSGSRCGSGQSAPPIGHK